MESLESLLVAHPLLAGMDARHIARIAECASHATFASNQHLFRAGENADVCYLIRHGHVSVEIYDAQRGPITVQTLGEPSALGWSWLIPPYKWCFDARAIELTRVISLNTARLRVLCEQDHDLGYELLQRFAQVIAERLHAARFQLLDIYGERA
ncbi:MAG: cyclic nucleotide-binding domain-containing protein [Candidatus Hydrogenedentes bacterium]|nr:cyclic nucleotide-binding domain-containing protein [Candidatus Hydrogenedentota bacterium]